MNCGYDTIVRSYDASVYKFTGKERDTESGLDYFGARYYGSNMGRWMTPDWADKPEDVPYAQLDNPQSLNLYAYLGNNPLSSVDSDGHGPPAFADGGGLLASESSQPTASAFEQSSTSPQSVATTQTDTCTGDGCVAMLTGIPHGAKALAQQNQASGMGPGTPNVPVPGGNGAGWKWNADNGNSRGGTYGPDNWDRGTQGNPPSASWDENPGPNGVDHWDVKHGSKGPQQTDRYDEHGNPLTPDEAHGRPPRNANPMNIAPPSQSTMRRVTNQLIYVGIAALLVTAYLYRVATN